MEDLKAKAQDLTNSIKEYIDTYYKLSVLKATDKATSVTAGGLAAFTILFFGIFVLFFLGVALAVWLGQLINSFAGGFLIVAGLFLLIIVILVALRKKIVFPMFRNMIIRKMYE